MTLKLKNDQRSKMKNFDNFMKNLEKSQQYNKKQI